MRSTRLKLGHDSYKAIRAILQSNKNKIDTTKMLFVTVVFFYL